MAGLGFEPRCDSKSLLFRLTSLNLMPLSGSDKYLLLEDKEIETLRKKSTMFMVSKGQEWEENPAVHS